MDIKKLEKATKILNLIKMLDLEIIEVDRIAMLVANDETESSFELRVKNLTKKKEDDGTITFDEDGSLVKGNGIVPGMSFTLSPLSWFTPSGFPSSKPVEDNESIASLKPALSVTATLHILGVVLHEKNTERNKLLEQLKRCGVSV